MLCNITFRACNNNMKTTNKLFKGLNSPLLWIGIIGILIYFLNLSPLRDISIIIYIGYMSILVLVSAQKDKKIYGLLGNAGIVEISIVTIIFSIYVISYLLYIQNGCVDPVNDPAILKTCVDVSKVLNFNLERFFFG